MLLSYENTAAPLLPGRRWGGPFDVFQSANVRRSVQTNEKELTKMSETLGLGPHVTSQRVV